MPQSPELRIIIPACDEAARVEPTVRDYCETFSDSATILVVSNGCSDNTAGIVRAMQERHANLRLIDVGGRIGKGGAVRVGLCTGTEAYVGFVDADGSTSAAEFRRLFRVLVEGKTDAVIGSRWLPGSRVEPAQPKARRIASRAFNGLARLLFGIPFVDTQCGAKIFSRRAIAEIFRSLEVANFAFDIEVLWRLSRAGFTIREEPTRWSDQRTGTKVKLIASSWTMFNTLIRMRVRESASWLLPLLDRLAGSGVIPVIEQHRVLFLGDTIGALKGGDPKISALLNHLERLGIHVCDVEMEIDKPRLRALSARRDLLGALATFYWYATCSHRTYDGIVELGGARAGPIPALSTKPSFVLSAGPRRASRGQRSFYGRTAFLDLDEIPPEQAARTIAYVRAVSPHYAGAIFHGVDAVELHYPVEPDGPQLQLIQR